MILNCESCSGRKLSVAKAMFAGISDWGMLGAPWTDVENGGRMSFSPLAIDHMAIFTGVIGCEHGLKSWEEATKPFWA